MLYLNDLGMIIQTCTRVYFRPIDPAKEKRRDEPGFRRCIPLCSDGSVKEIL